MPKWTEKQEEAISKEGENIIVSAGAGSGKTAVLTARVIRKLKEGVNINKLLVLTFTNEAAGEMKERIRKAIKEEASLKDQLDYLEASYITTFDSYALAIVKKYNYVLNVSKNIKIVDSSIINVLRKQKLEEIFEDKYRLRDENFSKLIKDFCVKDDQLIKDAIIKISSALDLKENKDEYLKTYQDNFFSDLFINNIVNKYEELIINKVLNIKDVLLDISLLDELDEYQGFYDSLKNLITNDNYDEIAFCLDISLPRLKKNSPLKELKEEISTIIKELKGMCLYDSKQILIDSYKSSNSYVSSIIDIISLLDKEIDDYKFQNNSFEFIDIAKMAIKIVKENNEIRDEIKYFYNEIMLDEYQDTSNLQELFIKEIANHNVYMVGDIKQSIYRFRNANPTIFKEKYENYKDNQDGYKIDLLQNFRSRKEVLSSINTIFNKIMDIQIGGADYLTSHQMIFGNKVYEEENKENSYMDIYTYDPDDNYSKLEIEAKIIVNDIKEKLKNNYQVLDKKTNKLRDITLADFCIILDRGTDFDIYKKIFEYYNIPLNIYKDEDLTTGTDVILIKNILSLIIKIKNRVYDQEFRYLYTSIARSYLFNTSDQEIFNVFKNNDFYNTMIYKKCSDICKNLDVKNSYEIIDDIISSFAIIEKAITIGNIKKTLIRIDYLKSVIDNLVSLGYDPYLVNDYLKEMIATPGSIKYHLNNNNFTAVKIMNIHKSKGLEFPVCYFAGLYKKFNTEDIKDQFMVSEKYGIITPFFKEGIGSLFTKELEKEEYIKDEISERIRLFYVALTRAKEKIIIVMPNTLYYQKSYGVVPLKIREKYNSFLSIMDSIKDDLTDYIKNISIESINLSKDYTILKRINYKKYIKPNSKKIKECVINVSSSYVKPSHFSKTINNIITINEAKSLRLGSEIHHLFETADFKMGVSPYLDKFLSHDEFKNIKDANIYREYEFIDESEKEEAHGIIDLLIEYKDHLVIVDYKLNNIKDKAYLKQLNGYKKYIEKITSKPVFLYLYSIMSDEIMNLN